MGSLRARKEVSMASHHPGTESAWDGLDGQGRKVIWDRNKLVKISLGIGRIDTANEDNKESGAKN